MKFSVVIPTYQEETTLGRCLESMKNQSFPKDEFEVIVSDASSVDATKAVASRFAARVVVTEQRGIAHGRNFGAGQAQGTYLLFVDADVQLEAGFLMHLDHSFSDQQVVGVTGIAYPSDGARLPRLVYRATYVLVRFFHWFGLNLFPGICVAFRKKEFDWIGGFREDFGVTEDLDLSRRISRLGKCEVNTDAISFVSTRRLEKHLLSTVAFHIFNDLRYLFTGKAARSYPKIEEVRSAKDLWKVL